MFFFFCFFVFTFTTFLFAEFHALNELLHPLELLVSLIDRKSLLSVDPWESLSNRMVNNNDGILDGEM